MCGAPGDSSKSYTWMAGIEACQSKEKDDKPDDDKKDDKCKECGTSKDGTSSCCADGASWYGNCGAKNDGKDHTWTEGIEACAGKKDDKKDDDKKDDKCKDCGTLANGKLSCCAEGGSWNAMCGAPGDSSKSYTWMEG